MQIQGLPSLPPPSKSRGGGKCVSGSAAGGGRGRGGESDGGVSGEG